MIQTVKRDRIVGIDVFRFISFCAVALLHAESELKKASTDITIDTESLTRFAVPFFFIASGYFLQRRDAPMADNFIKLVKRIAPIFIFWMAVYLITFRQGDFYQHPKIMLGLVSPAYHLWFLPSLFICLSLLLLLRQMGWAVLFCVGVMLYAAGLCFGPYDASLRLPHTVIDTRNGPFFGFLFVTTGYYLAKNDIRFSIKTSILMILAGIAIQFIEMAVLSNTNGFKSYDCLIGTVPYGIGMFMLSMSVKGNSRIVSMLAYLGTISLGFYCFHVLPLEGFNHILHVDNQGTALLLWLTTVLVAIPCVALMAKIPHLKKTVT